MLWCWVWTPEGSRDKRLHSNTGTNNNTTNTDAETTVVYHNYSLNQPFIIWQFDVEWKLFLAFSKSGTSEVNVTKTKTLIISDKTTDKYRKQSQMRKQNNEGVKNHLRQKHKVFNLWQQTIKNTEIKPVSDSNDGKLEV